MLILYQEEKKGQSRSQVDRHLKQNDEVQLMPFVKLNKKETNFT